MTMSDTDTTEVSETAPIDLVSLPALHRRFPESEQSTPSFAGTLPSPEPESEPAPEVREDVTNATLITEQQMLTYPYRAIGSVQKRKPGGWSWQNWGSGVLVGPWHVLTASHVLNGDPAGTEYRFAPAHWNGEQGDAGFSWSTARIVNRIGINIDHVSGYDYLICELDNPLGSEWGWWSTKGSNNDGYYTNATWNTVGYPGNLLSGLYPHKNGVVVTGVDDDDHNGKAINGRSDVAGGWSGGPLVGPGLGIWGDVVGVLSGSNDGGDQPGEWEDVAFAGGPDMVRLVKWGLDNWYRWVAKPENMTASFGYTKPRTGAGVAAVSWGKGRIDLFWRSSDNHLRHAWYPHHGGWSWEQDMTASFGLTPLSSDPAVVSDGEGRADVFWRSSDGHLRHIWYPGLSGDWSHEEDMTASFGLTPTASAPTAASWELGRFDVFWRSSDGHLRHVWYPHHGGWSWEQDMTAGFGLTPSASAPAAASWGPGRIDLFWRSSDDHLRHVWYPHNGDWSWEQDMTTSFGHGPAKGSPAVTSWAPGRLDLLWRESDDHLGHAWNDSPEWSGTEDMSDMFISTVRGTPAACTWQPLRLDFFWVDEDKFIQHGWYANATG